MTTMSIGKPVTRVDGRAKVTGAARYAADFNQRAQLHAVIVSATAGLGRVTALDEAPVRAMPGVVEVIIHLNAPRLAYGPHKSFIDPEVGERLHVLQDDRVRFDGQPIAVVVADTLDHAERAANALRISYSAERPVVDPRDPTAQAVEPSGSSGHSHAARGDADRALADAPLRST
jgi:xanthine dehydrogenase YagR molybdenum-binding subunit